MKYVQRMWDIGVTSRECRFIEYKTLKLTVRMIEKREKICFYYNHM